MQTENNKNKVSAMETNRKNFILQLLECKKELRECIQKGADPEEMKRIADEHGFRFATPI